MSLILTRAQNAQGVYPNGFDWPAHRQQNYGYIAAFQKSNLLTPEAKALLTSGNNWNAPALQLPVMTKGNATVTQTAQTCAFSTGSSTSSFVSVVFIQGFFDTQIYHNESIGNKISQDQDFMNQFKGGEENMADIIELAMYNAMDAARSTTYNSNFIGLGKRYGALVGDAIQVSNTLAPTFFYDGKSIMFADNFGRTGNNVIGDAQLASYFDFYNAQGSANQQNLNPQFAGYDFSTSNSTVTTGTAVSTGFIFAPNMLDMVSRVSPVFTNGIPTKDITFGTHRSELLGIDLGWKKQISCVSSDAVIGTTPPKNALSTMEQMTFSYDVAIIIANDPSTNGGIKKFDINA